MKTIYRLILPLLVLGILVTSCSKDEPISASKSGTLGFTSLLNDFIEGGRLADELPECSDESPFTVCVKIKDSDGNWVLDQTPLGDGDGLGAGDDNIIEIKIAPLSGVDVDNDGDNDNWFTEESESLELEEGDYSIEYFIVKDEAGNAILAAPHESADYGDVQYQNFVTDALPINLTLYAGTKKYVDVEVLCFEEHFALEFGYLFFDVIEIEQQHVCIFGNVCEDNGRHHPAHFRAKIWESDPGAADGKGDLLFDGENEYGINAAGEEYARPLCIPLPDREDVLEEFYGEIWLIDGALNETLIREGIFTEDDIKNLYINSDTSYYWHFREGCEQCDDEPYLLGDGCEDCIGEHLQTILDLGITLNLGNTPPNLEGIYLFDELTLLASNIPGDLIGQSFSNVKIRITNQVATSTGADIMYERKGSGSSTPIPQEGRITGSGNDFSIYTCAIIRNDAETDSIKLAYVYSGTLGANGLEDVSYVLLNVDDFGDPGGSFIAEGQGRWIDEADGEATESGDFNIRVSNPNGRVVIEDVQRND
ncbi:MAG: hypothetical protein KDD32_07490 [Bacteroidetes bacterium]|nr:hypothetical protein [Bacteroidota bacterium]